MEFILASSSPRRIIILYKLGINFRVFTPRFEVSVQGKDPIEIARTRALEKARSVAGMFFEGIVIGADTVVSTEDGEILGKPKNSEEAIIFLKKLSGKWHLVVTGLALIDSKKGKEYVDHSITEVKFRDITNDEISKYIELVEPLDKAGAYSIQGLASIFVEQIKGDYWNVVGLPIYLLDKMLKKYFNLSLLDLSKPQVSLL